MSDSTFNANLDALVRGENPGHNDELIRFAADLYGKEHAVKMPGTLKLQIASELGLTVNERPNTSPAPVSRRTLRSMEKTPSRGKPWAMVLAIAATLVLIVAGVYRWGSITGNDSNDNQYLFSTPAVPTVATTPEASPETNETSWLMPINSADCTTDSEVEDPSVTVEEFDALPPREYIFVGPADPNDANSANVVARHYMSCDYNASFGSDRFVMEQVFSRDQILPANVVLLRQQYEDGKAVSEALSASGLGPSDLAVTVGGDNPDFSEIENGDYFIPNPDAALALENDRIVVPASRVTVKQRGESATPNVPMAVSTAFVFIEENGEWKIDSVVPICLGDCDMAWSQLETMYTDALWLTPIAAEECTTNSFLPEILSPAEIAVIQSRTYRACEMSGDASEMQSSAFRVSDGDEAFSDEVDRAHRQNGETAGSLNRIVQPGLFGPEIEVPTEPWIAYQPGSVVTLEDGRIAVLETTAISADSVAGSGRTSPVITTALVWSVDGDTWQLDEEVTVCFGSCDAHWGLDASTPPSEAVSIVESLPDTCESTSEFEAHLMSDSRIAIGMRPGPGIGSGVVTEYLPAGTPLQYLCEIQVTTNPQLDRMEDHNSWLLVRTADGTEGWIREVDVQVPGSEGQ